MLMWWPRSDSWSVRCYPEFSRTAPFHEIGPNGAMGPLRPIGSNESLFCACRRENQSKKFSGRCCIQGVHGSVFGCDSPPRRLRPVRRGGRCDGPRYRRAHRGDGGCWCQGFRWRAAPGTKPEVAAGAPGWQGAHHRRTVPGDQRAHGSHGTAHRGADRCDNRPRRRQQRGVRRDQVIQDHFPNLEPGKARESGQRREPPFPL